jgi:hypothetical protein
MTYIPPEGMIFPVTWVCGNYFIQDTDCVLYVDAEVVDLNLPLAQDFFGRKLYVKVANGGEATIVTQEDDLVNGQGSFAFTAGCYEFLALDWGIWETIAFSEV